MRFPPALLAALLLVSGCGVPQELPKQAEEVESVAAEGELLAHDAAQGDTTDAFRRVHAQALRRQLEGLRGAIDDPRLAAVAATVSDELRRLELDAAGAAVVERRLARAGESAGEVAR